MSISYLGSDDFPTVIIDSYTLLQFKHIVDTVGNREAEWYGFSTYQEKSNLILIQGDALLPKQSVSSATATVTEEQMGEFLEYADDHCENGKKSYSINQMNVHMHSHVNMNTSPSGQDEKQKMELAEDYRRNYLDENSDYNERYLVKGIMNKKDEVFLEVIDLETWMVKKCQWSEAYYGDTLDRIAEEVKGVTNKIASTTTLAPTNSTANSRVSGYTEFSVRKGNITTILPPADVARLMYALAGSSSSSPIKGNDLKDFNKLIKDLKVDDIIKDYGHYQIWTDTFVTFNYQKEQANLSIYKSAYAITEELSTCLIKDQVDEYDFEDVIFTNDPTGFSKFYYAGGVM